MLSLTACPEPGCASPAEIVDRRTLPSTDGPVEHARVRCLHRHWFVLPVAALAGRAGREAVRYGDGDPRRRGRARP